MAARVHNVAMAAMHADRQILEEHLDFEATINIATRLSTLKYNSCCFLEATASVF